MSSLYWKHLESCHRSRPQVHGRFELVPLFRPCADQRILTICVSRGDHGPFSNQRSARAAVEHEVGDMWLFQREDAIEEILLGSTASSARGQDKHYSGSLIDQPGKFAEIDERHRAETLLELTRTSRTDRTPR